jgi:hypothetical protein
VALAQPLEDDRTEVSEESRSPLEKSFPRRKELFMKRLDSLCLTGAVTALALVSLPAVAQDTTTTQSTKVNRERVMSMQNDMTWDRTLPAATAQPRLLLLQTMSDKNFTKVDIEKILPLLQDLRDAERLYTFGLQDAAGYWVTLPDQSKVNGMDEVRAAANGFRDRRQAIWAAIDTAIGADKSSALRALVEPMKVDYSTMAYTDEHIQRIDEIIRDWDRMAAARVAANGGTPPSTVTTVSTETRTVTQTIPGFEVYTYPPLSTRDLVDAMQLRLAALEANGLPEAIIAIRGEEFTSPNLQYLREKHLKYWD